MFFVADEAISDANYTQVCSLRFCELEMHQSLIEVQGIRVFKLLHLRLVNTRKFKKTVFNIWMFKRIQSEVQ